jgi:hypothetical protein
MPGSSLGNGSALQKVEKTGGGMSAGPGFSDEEGEARRDTSPRAATRGILHEEREAEAGTCPKGRKKSSLG